MWFRGVTVRRNQILVTLTVFSCSFIIFPICTFLYEHPVNNGNWTESSTQHSFDLKLQVWFQTKIAWHKVQLPIYYIHFEIAQIQDLVSSKISLMQYWAGLKLNSSIFWGKKQEFWKQRLQNFPHDTLSLSFSSN